MIYINNQKKIENIKLDKNNFYVVADFDKTLTKCQGGLNTTWGVMANANEVGDDYTKERMALYNHYRPIEIDMTLSDEKKSEEMSNWYKAHINLFYKYGLKEISLINSVRKNGLKYRPGAKEFLRKMKEFDIPIIIISAGIGNVIREFLKDEDDFTENIKIVSNFIHFEKGVIKGIQGDIIHSLNKNIVKLDNTSKEKIKNRKNILLFGDGLADLKMISKEELENTISVGFLEEKVEENLKYYNESFDIVLTNNGTFNDVNKILKIY